MFPKPCIRLRRHQVLPLAAIVVRAHRARLRVGVEAGGQTRGRLLVGRGGPAVLEHEQILIAVA